MRGPRAAIGTVVALGLFGCEREGDPPRDADVADASPRDADVADASPRDAAVDVPPRTLQPRVDPRPEGRWTIDRRPFGAIEGVSNVVLGDCNDDGRLDAVALSAGDLARLFVGAHEGATVRFEARAAALPRLVAPTGVFADVNHDGRDDLVLAGANIEVVIAQGDCRFAPGVVTLGTYADDRAVQALATDVDLDGRTDLSVSQAYPVAAPHRLFIARGDGSYDEFAPRATPLPFERRQPNYIGFGMFFEDLDGDGAMDLFALCDQRQAWFSWGVQPREIAQRRDDSASSQLALADAMGVSPIDHDRDGEIEWFVPGVYSRSRLLRHVGAQRLVDDAPAAELAGVGDDFAWGSYTFDADLDGWLDLLVLRQGPEMDPRVPPNPGPVDLFFNRHDGVFVELGARALDLRLRAKGLACAPLTDAGPIACLALDRDGPVLMVNTLRPQGRQAVLRLRGTVSAVDATGARVTVEGVTPPQVYVVGGQCPYGAEHGRALQIALGATATARVTVRWPSGLVQRGVTVTADARNVITEPEAVTLSRRAAPADARETVTVTVDPRAAGASAARLERTGAGEWTGDAVTDAQGRLSRTLRAPSQPGEARVLVSLDGATLRVAPRVVFRAVRP